MREFTNKSALALISRMRGMYGKRFTDQWAGVEPEEIIFAMVDCLNGLSDDELRVGFERMKTSVFCPSIPEFRSWCEAASPYLTENEAWLQAVRLDRKGGSGEITRLAKQAYDLVHMNKDQYLDAGKQNFFMFRDSYLRIVEEAKRNGIRDEVIPAPKRVEYKAEPLEKTPVIQHTPEQKEWVENRIKELQEAGESLPKSMFQAYSEMAKQRVEQ